MKGGKERGELSTQTRCLLTGLNLKPVSMEAANFAQARRQWGLLMTEFI